MTRYPTICDACTRLQLRANPDSYTTADRYISFCAAFPDMIPHDIFPLGYDHRNPYPGDGGITFELAEGKEKILGLYEELTPEERKYPQPSQDRSSGQ